MTPLPEFSVSYIVIISVAGVRVPRPSARVLRAPIVRSRAVTVSHSVAAAARRSGECECEDGRQQNNGFKL